MNLELEEIINQNEWLIYSFIKDYKNYVDVDDLKQVAAIGIIKAYKNYDNTKGVKFSSYAYKYIAGELKKFLRENRTIKINKDTSTLCNKIKKAQDLLEQKLMRIPTNEELCQFLEIDELTLEMALNIQNTPQSLDQPIFNDGGKAMDLYEELPESRKNNIDDLILLRDCLNNLTQDEKELINNRYMNDYTQSETSKLIGMSQVQVSRKEHKVLEKLKQKMIV